MEIKSASSRGNLYLYPSGELDEYTAKKAKNQIENAIKSTDGLKSVVFNFANTTFMDSTGIGVLLGRYKTLKKINVPVFIQNPSASVNKILQISGIYDIMPKI